MSFQNEKNSSLAEGAKVYRLFKNTEPAQEVVVSTQKPFQAKSSAVIKNRGMTHAEVKEYSPQSLLQDQKSIQALEASLGELQFLQAKLKFFLQELEELAQNRLS